MGGVFPSSGGSGTAGALETVCLRADGRITWTFGLHSPADMRVPDENEVKQTDPATSAVQRASFNMAKDVCCPQANSTALRSENRSMTTSG